MPSRRAWTIETRDDMQAFVRARLFPRTQLHALIVRASASLFTLGQYDTAVFAAFKEVEIAVRNASKCPSSLVGEKLMRAAFDPAKGPLVDHREEESEKAALAHLFAGAMGRYRNATGHRRVEVAPAEAVELLVLASHLLGIVDSRISSLGSEEDS